MVHLLGKQTEMGKVVLALAGLGLIVQVASAVITVQIGGANRLNSVSRSRERYSCYWDCDLVGCQIAKEDDECAYDCEKICRVRFDYAGRSGLEPKSGEPAAPEAGKPAELVGEGASVRLVLPRNASARNFAIWERCSSDSSTGRLTEQPFSL